EPPLRIARLRAEGRVLEIGPDDLSLTLEEDAFLLRDAGLALGADAVAGLHPRAGAWPGGGYLAELYLRGSGSVPGAEWSLCGGDGRLVCESMESEFSARICRQQRECLTRPAVRKRMSGPLRDAAPERPGSAAEFTALARWNPQPVPLSRGGQW